MTKVKDVQTVLTKGKKANLEDVLIEILKKYPLVRTDIDCFARITRHGKQCTLSLNSEEFTLFVKSTCKEITGTFPSNVTLKNCIDYIKHSSYALPITKIKYRVAVNSDDSIIYDLCDGNCVKIDSKSWHIEPNNHPMFRQSNDQLPQVTPIYSENGWERLYKYLNIPEEKKLLLLVYIIACLNDKIVSPSISINGTNGSGKSTLSKIIKRIIDPSISELEALPKSLNNLKLRLSTGYYSAFDNLSKLSSKQSDFLCSVITEISCTEREYYTNHDILCSHLRRSMCLNGISNFIFRGDLAERILFFNTQLIRDKMRKGDGELWDNFNKDLPYIMGGIFTLLSKALALLPNTKLDNPLRLADFHKFGIAIANAMGNLGNDFDQAFRANKEYQLEITGQHAPLINILVDFLEENDGVWRGTMSLLFNSLENFIYENPDKEYDLTRFPKASNSLSCQLKSHAAALASKGVTFWGKKNGGGNSEIAFTTNRIIRKPIILDTNKKRKFITRSIDKFIRNNNVI